jgi:hypothetical protein
MEKDYRPYNREKNGVMEKDYRPRKLSETKAGFGEGLPAKLVAGIRME